MSHSVLIRLSEDCKRTYLAEYSDTELGKFKVSAGKSYKEAVNTLIYFTDLVYFHSTWIYEQRKLNIHIHCHIHKQ